LGKPSKLPDADKRNTFGEQSEVGD